MNEDSSVLVAEIKLNCLNTCVDKCWVHSMALVTLVDEGILVGNVRAAW